MAGLPSTPSTQQQVCGRWITWSLAGHLLVVIPLLLCHIIGWKEEIRRCGRVREYQAECRHRSSRRLSGRHRATSLVTRECLNTPKPGTAGRSALRHRLATACRHRRSAHAVHHGHVVLSSDQAAVRQSARPSLPSRCARFARRSRNTVS